MRKALLDVLACPDCRGSVTLVNVESQDDAGIIGGTLKCSGCSREFPIIDGIPHMMPAPSDEDRR